MNNPSQAILRELLLYSPTVGTFTWRFRSNKWFNSPSYAKTWNTKFAGVPAFITDNGNGYLCGWIFSQKHYAHRVAWAYETGEWVDELDHADRNGHHNWISNLSPTTHADNLKNNSMRTDNASEVTGVSWDATRKKWQAYINLDQKRISLGRFSSKEAAINARTHALSQAGYAPNHGV